MDFYFERTSHFTVFHISQGKLLRFRVASNAAPPTLNYPLAQDSVNQGEKSMESKMDAKSMSGHSSHDMSMSNHELDAPSVIADTISLFIAA